MRYTRTLFTLAAGSMLAACQRDLPTAPANRELVVSAASFNGATQDWERRTIFNDHTFFIPCLNENARIYGYVSYQLHEVATPSGGYDFVIQYLPQTPKDPPFVLQGLTSGKVFYYAFGRPVIVSFHSGAGETQTQIVNEKYVAADGSTILGDARFHYTVNANGELAVSRDVGYALTCV
jgi:hypothetical protein